MLSVNYISKAGRNKIKQKKNAFFRKKEQRFMGHYIMNSNEGSHYHNWKWNIYNIEIARDQRQSSFRKENK